MKNLLLSALVLLLGSTTFAAGAAKKASAPASQGVHRNYGMAGCGLGSIVIDKKGPQIFSSTTTGLTATNFFGITFGTSNCVDSETSAMASRVDRFVEVNKVALASDMAKGQGETLATLGTMFKCEDTQKLNVAMQKNFGEVFPSYDVDTMTVTDRIMTVIINDKELSKSCKASAVNG